VLASLLALWCQIVLGTALVPVAFDPLANAAICHEDGGQAPRQQPIHHDCALCVQCLLHVASIALPPQPPAAPTPPAITLAANEAIPQAPPPRRITIAAQPRGPPALT
jgi:hypothetical protein